MLNFLQDLQQRGISLSAQDGALKVQAPKGAITVELREALLTHRTAVLAYLQTYLHESANDDGAALPVCVPDPARVHEPFPLADLQLGFYMADDPYMDFHVRPHYYVEKDGAEIDARAYEAAWNKTLRRHRHDIPVVRPEGDLQTVCELSPLAIPVIDSRHLPVEEATRRLASIRAEMMRSELPLDRWPWLDIRVSLWCEDGLPRSRVHCNFNNFFVDGFGTTRLLQEVERYYADPGLTLAPLRLSFRDAVVALEALAASAAGQAARRYWEERLPQLPGPPEIPLKAGMDRRCRSRLSRRKQALDATVWSQFKAHAQQAGLTPSNALFAVYAEVVAAWSNNRHFVFSNMMTRRMNIHPEIREIAGNFASLYPLEIDLRGGGSFIERARRVQEQVIRDAQHLQWGGMQVLQALNRLKGSFGRAPIPFVVGSGLFIDAFELDGFSCLETSQVMLDFQFFESGDGRLCYVWDLLEEFFPDGLIDDMWSALAGLIEALAHDAGLWQSTRFDLIPARHLAERMTAGQGAQAVPEEMPEARLEDLLQHGAAAGVALLTPDARLCYRDLREGAQRLGALLRQSGVRRGDTVAVLAERGPDLLMAVYGILQAGAAYVPIDPSLPEERRTYLLENCGARHAIAGALHARTLRWPQGLTVLAADADAAAASAATETECGGATDLAYVIYTSGSTGRPKGVMIDHRGAMNTILAVNQRFNVGAGDRLFGVSSFGFDLSVYDIFGAVAAGATLVYPDPHRALDPAHWLDMLGEHGVTIWNSAPPLAVLLVELAEYRAALLPDLRLVLLSGDWIPIDLPDRIRGIAPNAQIVSLGGATEASIWSIWYPIGVVDRAWPSIPYGFPMPNQPWHVLDDCGRPAPEWTAGELVIGGIGLAQGYWRDPEKTAASFIAHPVSGERLYRTGDIGRYLPGGVIEFMGRRDTQVKIQGHRIELGEIEAVLAGHPGVGRAVVAAQKQQGGGAQLVAHVVTQPGVAVPGSAELQEFLGRQLPGYMVPRLFNFLPHLPLSSNGKIDRLALPRLEQQAVKLATERRTEPQDEIETQLLAIWRQVLKRDALALTDDFFDLGGQSFEAVRVVGLIREVLKAALSIGDIWEYRSIARLAVRLRAGDAGLARRCLIELGSGSGAPLFLVHPAGGHVLCYRALAQGLRRPVQAFQAPGLEGRDVSLDAPLESIPALAAHYLPHLLRAQPEGPVLLGGWSSGALIAYEMAVQLRARGREVAGLIVFDSPAPLVHEPVSDEVLFDWFVGDLNLDPAVRDALRQTDYRGLTEQQKLERAAAGLRAGGVDLGADAAQLIAIYRVFKGIVRGGRNYHAAATDVDMLIFRARHGSVDEFARHPYADSAAWGWERLSSGVINSMEIDGNHHGLLAGPALEAVLRLTESWLGKEK